MPSDNELNATLRRIRRALEERRITWSAAMKLAARAKAKHG